MPRCSACGHSCALYKIVDGRCPNCKKRGTFVVNYDHRISMAIGKPSFDNIMKDARTRAEVLSKPGGYKKSDRTGPSLE